MAIADVRDWHNYRFAVLGDDGTGTIRANFYQDRTLVIENLEVGTAGTTDGSDYMWNGCEWGSEIAGGLHPVEYDWIRVDAEGAWAPRPVDCGDYGTEYNTTDLNLDCMVDLFDYEVMADQWMRCTNPADGDCEELPWIYEDFSAADWLAGAPPSGYPSDVHQMNDGYEQWLGCRSQRYDLERRACL